MAVNTNISAYPWLCSTMKKQQDYECGSSDNGSSISQNESNNVEAFTTEAYGTFGLQCIYYKVSEHLRRDKIFGEDQLQVVERAFNFIMYTEQLPPNVRTYQLQGIWGEDVITSYVGITAFKYWSTYGGSDRNTPLVYDDFVPRIGDVVYLPQNDTFYEIRDVKYYQEAFGLASHTYTLTLKVYKDTKLTILNDSPTIPQEDPVWAVATQDFPEQYNINDPLKKNVLLDDQELKKSKNVNHMDVLYNPNKAYEGLEEYSKTIENRFDKYEGALDGVSEQIDQINEGADDTEQDIQDFQAEFDRKAKEYKDKLKDIEDDLENIDVDVVDYNEKS